MAELADARDLGSRSLRSEGSTPSLPTKSFEQVSEQCAEAQDRRKAGDSGHPLSLGILLTLHLHHSMAQIMNP